MQRKYLASGIALLAIGGVMLALTLPTLIITPRPPPMNFMSGNENYNLAFYLAVIGGALSSIGLIFVAIHKAGISEIRARNQLDG